MMNRHIQLIRRYLYTIGISSVFVAALAADTNLSPERVKSVSGTGGVATRAFTGIWDQPTHESQGTVIQMVDNGSGGLDAVVYWFVYDENATPYWYVGQGPVTGDRIDLTIYEVTGPTFLSPANPLDRNLQEWGTGSIQFDNCNTGTFVALNSVSGTGGFQFPIQKLASVANTDCAGGTSDAVNPDDTPVDIRSFFTATATGAGASGIAEFEISGGRTEFKVEAEDLNTGDYSLFVDGVQVGEFEVIEINAGNNQGEIEFRSPADPGKILLTFDPRGKTVEVFNMSNAVVLTQEFPAMSGDGGGGLPGGMDLEIEFDMDNSGVYPLADAEARFEQRPDRTDFSVEIEDVPVGDYTLTVSGTVRGTISVTDSPEGTQGEIEFRNPVEAGKMLLDFDPRGSLIEVLEGSTVIFSTDFSGSGNGNGGDDNSTVEFNFPMTNTGVDSLIVGNVKYEDYPNQEEVEVEVENASSDGDYSVFVNGALKGTFEVEDGDGDLKFSSPQDDDDLLLDFDPFGATISVNLDGAEVLTVTIPQS